MKVPYLKKKPEIKSCHNIEWEDNYSWIHQKNILEVLKDKSKLDPEVKKYLDEDDFAEWKSLSEGGDLSPYMIRWLKREDPSFNDRMFRVEEGQYRGMRSLNELADNIGNRKKDPWFDNEGASRLQIEEDKIREPDPFVNPDKFNDSEKSTHFNEQPNKKVAARKVVEEA